MAFLDASDWVTDNSLSMDYRSFNPFDWWFVIDDGTGFLERSNTKWHQMSFVFVLHHWSFLHFLILPASVPRSLCSSVVMTGCLGGFGEKWLSAVWVNADDVCRMFLRHHYSSVHMRDFSYDYIALQKHVFWIISITDVCVCAYPIIEEPVLWRGPFLPPLYLPTHHTVVFITLLQW